MDIKKALIFLRKTIEGTAIGSIRALSKRTFKVKMDKPVEISLKDLPKKLEVNNDVKQALYKLIEALKDIPKTTETKSIFSTDPKKYVPVRLSTGSKFYKAIEDLIVSAASHYSFSQTDGKRQNALIDTDRHVQVDVLTMPSINIPTPVGGATSENQDPLAKYKISDTDDDAEPNYFGFVTTDGKWYILKEENKTYRYIFGTEDYSTNWTGRAGLTYGYLFE